MAPPKPVRHGMSPLGQNALEPSTIPFAEDVPHTFLYSTDTGKGLGLTIASNLWLASAVAGYSVKGRLEPDDPFSSPGKYKPGFSCWDASKSKCVEKCVNDNFKPPFPNWQLNYTCHDWADDILQKCKVNCGKLAR